jgi:hypothetical protein
LNEFPPARRLAERIRCRRSGHTARVELPPRSDLRLPSSPVQDALPCTFVWTAIWRPFSTPARPLRPLRTLAAGRRSLRRRPRPRRTPASGSRRRRRSRWAARERVRVTPFEVRTSATHHEELVAVPGRRGRGPAWGRQPPEGTVGRDGEADVVSHRSVGVPSGARRDRRDGGGKPGGGRGRRRWKGEPGGAGVARNIERGDESGGSSREVQVLDELCAAT